MKNGVQLLAVFIILCFGGVAAMSQETDEVLDGADNAASAAIDRSATGEGENFTPYLEPVYRPIPAQVAGVETPELLLDGVWRTRVESAFPADLPGADDLSDEGWKAINIPGQYLQQGFGPAKLGHTIVFGQPNLTLTYSGLPVGETLELAVSYCTEAGNEREQFLRVNGQPLGEPFNLTQGQVSREVFTLPADAVQDDGSLAFEVVCVKGHNAVLDSAEIRQAGAETPLISEDFEGMQTAGTLEGNFFTMPLTGNGIQATLVCDFDVPADWAGQSAILRLEAVHGEADYFLNGKALGHSAIVFVPVEFDVTDVLEAGQQNRLTLQMTMDPEGMPDRMSFGSKYAHHNIGGIHRSVRLFAKPRTHLERLYIDPQLDAALEQGELRLKAKLQGSGKVSRQLEVIATAPDGAQHQERFDLPAPGEEAELVLPVANPALWNAEKPRLYDVQVTLLEGGEVLESLMRCVGFRRLEVVGSDLLVNGQRVKLAGINRHEIDPLTGRAATARWARKDAELFREANCNYIRTSHYPPTREFLEACDELGIYVECEAALTWVSRIDEDPSAINWFLNPAAAMLEYHHAHPSVIIWSLANESGYHKGEGDGLPLNFVMMNAFVQQRDPSRPTAFNNQFANDAQLCDIGISHYNPNDDLDGYLVDIDDPRPILIDETFHINCYDVDELTIDPGIREEWCRGVYCFGGRDTAPHWDANATWHRMYHSERWLGAAIWGGIDEVFRISETHIDGYGPWGIIDGWRRKKPEWWLTKKLYTPVWLKGYSHEPAPKGIAIKVEFENRYSFTDLSELEFIWRAGAQEVAMTGPEIAPLSSGEWTVQLPDEGAPSWTLEVIGIDGKSVVSYGIELEASARPAVEMPMAGRPDGSMVEDGLRLQLGSGLLSVDRATGEFGEGDAVLQQLPAVFVTQAEGKMVFVPQHPPYEEYPGAAAREIKRLELIEGEENSALVLQENVGDFTGGWRWTLDRTGRGIIEYDYTYNGPERFVRETGLHLRLAATPGELSWQGGGNWKVYPAGHIGRGAGMARFELPDPAVAQWDFIGSYYGMTPPEWDWEQDVNGYGSADFRATKFNVGQAAWRNDEGDRIEVIPASDTNRIRAFYRDEVIHLIVSQDEPYQLKPGAKIAGRMALHFPRR